MDPDMTPGSIPGPVDPMTPGGSTGHLEWLVPNLSLALESPHGSRFGPRSRIYVLPLMVMRALNFSACPVFGRATNPDIALDTFQASKMHWPWVTSSVIQVCMSSAAAHTLTSRRSHIGGGSDSGNQCSLCWQHKTQASAQTQAAIGPWIQTWSLATTQAWMSSYLALQIAPIWVWYKW